MSDIAIRVQNLGKRYRIGRAQRRHDTLRDTLMASARAPLQWFAKNRNGTPGDEWIWALKDVSFEIQRGEVVGVIGRNGAGKSTLLKILSRITEPTEGYAEIHGRVGTLLEVGTGFHPELTGRENIYLSGAILGMRKAEIDRRFDEIVAFAEIEKFIDTPVKHYSSGMYVRLAFAVAAHLEPEILLVDEVLAVGDAAFQKKCLGKMGDVAKEGRTVLFVSHNMAAVESLCPGCILIADGDIKAFGRTREVVEKYLKQTIEVGKGYVDLRSHPGRTNGSVQTMTEISFLSDTGDIVSSIQMGESLSVRVAFLSEGKQIKPVLGIVIKDSHGSSISGVNNRFIMGANPSSHLSAGRITWLLPRLPLMPGTYTLDLFLGDDQRDFDIVHDAVSFEVLPSDVYGTGKLPPPSAGPIFLPASWTIEAVQK